MGELAVGFNIPEYITEEVKEYIKDESNGKNRYMKFENIRALIGLAILNDRITKEEGREILNIIL